MIVLLVLKLYHLIEIPIFVWQVKCLASGSNIQRSFGRWRFEAGGWIGAGSHMEISLVVRNHLGSCFSRSKQRRSLGKISVFIVGVCVCFARENEGGGGTVHVATYKPDFHQTWGSKELVVWKLMEKEFYNSLVWTKHTIAGFSFKWTPIVELPYARFWKETYWNYMHLSSILLFSEK